MRTRGRSSSVSYIRSKTKASYQGTNDLKERVRDLLGVPKANVTDARIKALDGFFTARNDIVHRLDYVTPQGPSTKRHHRSPVAGRRSPVAGRRPTSSRNVTAYSLSRAT
jgi:hypothetical protein